MPSLPREAPRNLLGRVRWSELAPPSQHSGGLGTQPLVAESEGVLVPRGLGLKPSPSPW